MQIDLGDIRSQLNSVLGPYYVCQRIILKSRVNNPNRSLLAENTTLRKLEVEWMLENAPKYLRQAIQYIHDDF